MDRQLVERRGGLVRFEVQATFCQKIATNLQIRGIPIGKCPSHPRNQVCHKPNAILLSCLPLSNSSPTTPTQVESPDIIDIQIVLLMLSKALQQSNLWAWTSIGHKLYPQVLLELMKVPWYGIARNCLRKPFLLQELLVVAKKESVL